MAVAQPIASKLGAPAALAGYSILDMDTVIAFLDVRPHLVTVLEEAPRHLRQVFGKKLPLRVKVSHDREEPDSAELVVEIVTGEAGPDAWNDADLKLLRLHEDWLAALPRDVTRDILFVTEPE